MKPYVENRYLDRVDPDELVADGWQRQTSLKLPLAVSYLLDLRVEQANSGLEQAGEARTSRQEIVATLIATALRSDLEDLSLEERIMHYRKMTVGELLPELDEANR